MVNSFGSRPATRLGWWAVGVGAAYILLYAGSVVVRARSLTLPPLYGISMLPCGLRGGIQRLICSRPPDSSLASLR